MDTHRLQYFLRIADEGSISRAASVLGIAQPALSRQMRLLEEDLGITVFERTSRGVVLTEAGEQLRATAAGPLRELELALQWAGSPWARVERGLVVGMPAPIAYVLAAPLMSTLTARFPKVSITVAVSNSGKLYEGMLKDDVDFAIVHGPPPDDRLFYRDILSEQPVLVGGPESPLDADRPVEFGALGDLPMVLPTLDTNLSRSLHNNAHRHKITFTSRFETDSLQVSKSLIETGLAYALMPLSACRREVEAGRLRYAPVPDSGITQHVGLLLRPKLGLPRGFVIEFGRIVRAVAGQLNESGEWPATFLATDEWTDDAGIHCVDPSPRRDGMPQRSYGATD